MGVWGAEMSLPPQGMKGQLRGLNHEELGAAGVVDKLHCRS